MLQILAEWLEAGINVVDRFNWFVTSDQSPFSSSSTNNMSRLRVLGLVDYQAKGVFLTEAAKLLLPPASGPMTLQALHDAWRSIRGTKGPIVSRPQFAILEELLKCDDYSCDRKIELAQRTGASPTSSAYTNNVSYLKKSLGLIAYQGPKNVIATLTPRFLPDGLL